MAYNNIIVMKLKYAVLVQFCISISCKENKI